MNKLLIIHPEGNFSNNPNLFAIIHLLANNGFYIEAVAPKSNNHNQDLGIENFSFIAIDPDKTIEQNSEILGISLDKKEYSLVIGIDQGIVAASKLAAILNIPYMLISYEIMFGDEVSYDEKNAEIEACKNISFAVCQDPVRAFLLCEENEIDLDKILYIPVADKYSGPYKKSNYLREKLGISENKKIALYAGSISDWGMTEELINQAKTWTNDWVLVLHDRYGLPPAKYKKLINKHSNIYLSTVPAGTPGDLERIICSADAGVALYRCNFVSKYEGKNLLFLGLASGKIATYLKYGLGIAVNEIGQMSDYVRSYNLGVVINEISGFTSHSLDKVLGPDVSGNCLNFYRNKLDFSLYEKELTNMIESAIAGETLLRPDGEFNNRLSCEYSISMIHQIKEMQKLALSLYKSSYKAKIHSLIAPFNLFVKYIKKQLSKYKLFKKRNPYFNESIELAIRNLLKQNISG